MNIKHSDISIPNKSKRNKTTDFLITTETCALFIFACIFMYFFLSFSELNFWSCMLCTMHLPFITPFYVAYLAFCCYLYKFIPIHEKSEKKQIESNKRIYEYRLRKQVAKAKASFLCNTSCIRIFPILKHCPNGTKPNLR